MNFKLFLNSLPNGLHDAHISAINIDYVARSIKMFAEIWTGDLESNIDSIREGYKNAEICITNFQYIVIEQPDHNYGYNKKETLWIDAGEIDDLKKKPELPEAQANNFQFWIFVNDWNAFIYIAAESINIEWHDNR